MTLKVSSIMVLVVSGVFFSCKGKEDLTGPLIGNWNIVYSEMDGKPNAFMNKGFINFIDKKTLVTNIFGSEDTLAYGFDGTMLSIDSDEALEMEVTSFNSDSIVVKSQIQNFDMKFGLKKVNYVTFGTK
jgi:hypothetical protein